MILPNACRWLFDRIHTRNLIYNQCWEDPALDHEVLNIAPSDKIVMITSAGCNALDYLLRAPRRIDCVDVNPFQNALLELKLAGLKELSHWEFFEMFGRGRIANHRRIYDRRLREYLSMPSRRIWDERIDYFKSGGAGLYFHGASGFFARMVRWHLHTLCNLKHDLEEFQNVRDLAEQAEFYRRRIAPKLWNPAIRSLLRRPAVLSLLGVPIEQRQQIEKTTGADISTFIEQRVEATLTRIPIAANYFWRVYMNGHYTEECCPDYLKRENFQLLRWLAARVFVHTETLTEFLQSTPRQFSIFVLLDHMDWISRAPSLLEEEWRAIILRAVPGARIIYRSGGVNCSYIPEFAARRLELHAERTAKLNQRDRVGTYGSFHYATVTT
jgi:S-adenosylmethionine-diacylglycerol 3-amino-3-carboxypropyl transferase